MPIHLDRVLSHYDIGELCGAHPVEKGFVNENWRIETSLGAYFLKRYHPSLCHPEIVRAQHARIAHLKGAGFPAPIIMPTTDGDTLLALDGELCEIQTYIEGASYDHEQPAHFNEAARTLGRYHTCVEGFAPPALQNLGELYSPAVLHANLAALTDAWEIERDPDLAQTARQLAAQADDLATRFAAHGALPRLVIHGDYYADNLIFEHGRDSAHRIVGVVDYDKARWQPRVVELAEALIYFASPRPGRLKHLVYPGTLEWEPFKRFLHTYASVVPLAENEIRALPDYVRCIWLQMSLQRLWEKGPCPLEAPEALQEALTLGDWAKAGRQQMVEIAQSTNSYHPVTFSLETGI
ncbi:MAG: phosphotransferase [Anaerolineae bacterium]|nr:phosphotransferase [Anaerolineae bacterium]